MLDPFLKISFNSSCPLISRTQPSASARSFSSCPPQWRTSAHSQRPISGSVSFSSGWSCSKCSICLEHKRECSRWSGKYKDNKFVIFWFLTSYPPPSLSSLLFLCLSQELMNNKYSASTFLFADMYSTSTLTLLFFPAIPIMYFMVSTRCLKTLIFPAPHPYHSLLLLLLYSSDHLPGASPSSSWPAG